MQLKSTLIKILILLLPALSIAQSGQIRGRIYDASNNEPLPFANLIIQGTTIGSTSDLDGNFIFTGLQPGFVKVVASSVGYKPRISEEFQVTNAKVSFVDIPMEPTSLSIREVTVEASLFRKVEESPNSVRTLGISEIERTPGANRDISKVILSLPGVTNPVSFRNDLIVRGGGSGENRFFLDGMEIPNLNHFATQGASGGPTGIINTDFIREVDFYTGSFPANRGNALSSVMEIKQIDGNQDKTRLKTTVGASDLALSLNGPLGGRSTYLFSVRQSYLQLLFGLIGLPFLPTYNDYQLKIKTKFNIHNELNILSIGSLDKNTLNTDIKNPDEFQRYLLNNLPVNDQWTYAIGAVYKHYRENGFDTWVLSRNYLNNEFYKYVDNNPDSSKSLDYSSHEIENKFRFERLVRFGKYKLVAGAGAEYAKYFNATKNRIVVGENLINLEYESNIDLFKWNAFGQLSRDFLEEKLTLSLGLRADASSYSKSMSNLLDQLSPRFSARYALNSKVGLNFNTGRYYQLPAYTTLGYRNQLGELVNRNNNLLYIRADHVVAGVEYLPAKDSKLSLESFYKNYTHYPFSINDSVSLSSKGADFGTFGDEEVVSTAKGRAYGLELLFQDRDFYGFNLIMSYTLVRSEFEDKNGDLIPSSWDNRHLINITASRRIGKGWDAGVKWRFAGGAPFTPFDISTSSLIPVWEARGQGILDYSRFNTERYRAFHQLDLRVDKTWFFQSWSLNLFFDIQNIYKYAGEGRQILLQDLDGNGQPKIDPGDPSRYLLKTVEPSQGNIIPTFGIILEI
jgi:hypothetical protein